MISPRTSIEPTQEEIALFERFILDNNIRSDGQEGERNVLALGDYLIDIWKVQITPDSLEIALKKLTEAGNISYYTQVQAAYRRIAIEDADRANALNSWINSSANNSLVKEGDEGLQNQTAILTELRGRAISPQTIHEAIGRCSHRTGLHFVQRTETKADPRQHKDSGAFAPKTDNKKYVGGRLNHSFKEPGTDKTPKPAGPMDAWETLSKQLLNRGATHSQTAALAEVFEKSRASGKSWMETYSAMSALKRSYERIVPR